jgi:hypothetical protein
MEELDSNIEESIALELLTLRQTEPLKIEYEDFKNIPNFINVLEFEDPEITNLYNELLNGERLTLSVENGIAEATLFLNDFIAEANDKIKLINKFTNFNLILLEPITNYKEQDYKNILSIRIEQLSNLIDN